MLSASEPTSTAAAPEPPPTAPRRRAGLLAKLSRPAGLRSSAAYLSELEALRGWAVLVVVCSHIVAWLGYVYVPDESVSPLFAFALMGNTGVSLFFLLSAFFLSQPFLAEASGGRRVSILDFFRRRALRILPLYYAAVVVAIGFVLLRGAPAEGLWTYFFFLQRWRGVSTMVPFSAVWWSLCTEVQFYLVLPLFFLLLRWRWGRWLALGVAGIWLAAYGAVLAGRLRWGAPPFLDFLSFGRWHLFVLGTLVAWAYRRYGTRCAEALRRLPRGVCDLALVVALVALGYLLAAAAGMNGLAADNKWPIWRVYEALLWTSVLWLILTAPLLTKPLLCGRPMQILGVLSYSIYIVHDPLVTVMRVLFCAEDCFHGWRRVGALLFFAVATLLVSTATYLLIEQPFLRRKEGDAGARR